jgi:hypothetical protein
MATPTRTAAPPAPTMRRHLRGARARETERRYAGEGSFGATERKLPAGERDGAASWSPTN